MAVKLIVSLILTSALLAGCAPAPPKSLPPYMLGEWQGSDIRFHYHFYENGRYKLMYVPENELDTDGVYRIIGQDDENNIYVAMREKWHRPPPMEDYVYLYAKITWKYTELTQNTGYETLCVKTSPGVDYKLDEKAEWDTPPHQQMRKIRAIMKEDNAIHVQETYRLYGKYQKPDKNYDGFYSYQCYGNAFREKRDSNAPSSGHPRP